MKSLKYFVHGQIQITQQQCPDPVLHADINHPHHKCVARCVATDEMETGE